MKGIGIHTSKKWSAMFIPASPELSGTWLTAQEGSFLGPRSCLLSQQTRAQAVSTSVSCADCC